MGWLKSVLVLVLIVSAAAAEDATTADDDVVDVDAARRSFDTLKSSTLNDDTGALEAESSVEDSSESEENRSSEIGGGGMEDVTPLAAVPEPPGPKVKKSFIQKLGKTKAAKSPPPPPVIVEEEASVAASEALNGTVTATGLQWLMNLYNPFLWNDALFAQRGVSGECRRDLKTYLAALWEGSVWAAKMTDASGRYNSQFFFGNDFWLGSHSLCNELQNTRTNKIVPPFKAEFHVAKLLVKMPDQLTPAVRLISLGVCLPQTCTPSDIKNLVEPRDTGKKSPHSMKILNVRPVPGPYRILDDPTFQLMAFVMIVLIALMVIGSIYETVLERRMASIRREKLAVRSNNNVDYELKTPPMGKMGMNDDTACLKMSGSDLSSCSKPSTSFLGEVILSFSVITNGRKILNAGPPPPDSLNCVHGLRFLSLAWVIMVHTYLQVFAIAENKTLRTVTERNFMFQTISNATFSVDTFFFISGLLVTYLYFKASNKESDTSNRRPSQDGFKAGTSKFFTLLSYRYVRLTPAYMFVLGMAELSMRWLKNKSVFEPLRRDEVNCDLYWWRNALYINSLYPMKDMCMLWSWYMANDTQFYILGIIILLLSARYGKFSAISIAFFLLLSWFVTILISINVQYIAKIEDPFGNFDELYDKPWTRLGPYLVGMFAGWYLFRTKCKVRMNCTTIFLGWVLSLLTLASLVYGLHIFHLGVTGSAFYVSVGHSAWGAALAWIVIACCTGNGGCVNSLLSFRLLQPLSRLTYCAYLVHPVIMVLTSFQMDGPLHLHNGLVLILYFGNVVASFLLSFFISLTLEAPVVRLLKVALSPPQTKSSSKM
ncbi:unnamed protein product [Bemisia tabaci]|uniref:Nose resistant-to-fluoxetine protein N-terminal domain-containing protein n=1 Tax=Bemisia tabaci TaxID=7038 RepID=A0A9P0F5G2_BEMTA|nr:unnamed protein product [Bemisia tabaci]